MNKTKIAFLIHSLEGGGVERNIINLNYYLQKTDIQGDIFVFNNINDYKKEYSDLIEKINIIRIDYRGSLLTNVFFLKKLSLFLAVFKKIHNKNYNIIVGCLPYSTYYYATILAIFFKIKSVVIVSNNLTEKLKNTFILKKLSSYILLKLSFLLCNKIICSSFGLAYQLENNFGIKKEKIEVIYQSINLERIKEKKKGKLPQEYRYLFKKKPVIISCGRLVEQKNFTFLIKAFKEIKEVVSNAKLLILGKGPLKSKLQQLINELNLKDDVVLLGFQSNPYVFMRRADLFVLPSLYEGFANVIIEALACNVPIVSTDCNYGPREILLHKGTPTVSTRKIIYGTYGILTPITKPSHFGTKPSKVDTPFIKAILKLLIDNNFYKKYKMASLIRSKDFSLQKFGRKFLSVINSLICK